MVTRIRKGARGHLYIQEWMARLGLNDEALAGRMGTTRTTVWRWRTEQHRLNPEKIAQIAAALDLKPQQLWGPPTRPSLDAILVDEPDDVVRKAAAATAAWLKTGS